ncbi:MAG: hypothetical protein AcusKO_35020 [Acuticoccus sp.]
MTGETSAETTRAVVRLAGAVRQAWDGGGVVDMRLTALAPVDGWAVEVDLGGEIVNIWNARILGQDGRTYRLGPVDYNVLIPEGTAVEMGVEIKGAAQFAPLSAAGERSDVVAERTAQLAPLPPDAPAPAPAADAPPLPPGVDTAASQADGDAPPIVRGAPLGSGAVPLTPRSLRFFETPDAALPGFMVADDTVMRPTGSRADLPRDSFAPGPLATAGTRIVDSAGDRAEIHGVNWFGFETETFAPHGLWARNWRALLDEMKSLGFNTLRLPFSGELVRSGGGTPTSIDYALNPDLEGLDGLRILDGIVAYADTIGLRVLLDYHRGPVGSGPNDNGLWFGDGFTEADVIAVWQTMAARYRDAPAVIGGDLVNEPHMATWGDGSGTDWAAAAERIGNAVLAVAPDWLIVVEGVGAYGGETYWWGGNLMGVRERPVVLDVPNRLVYSPHDYPPSVHEQTWFTDGSNLTDVFRKNWGFIVEDGIAPVMLGEWGSFLATRADDAWADALAQYLSDLRIPWFWWALNPNSGDTGGVLMDDWTTVRPAVATLLDPFLDETRPPVAFDAAADTGARATFDVTLSEPAGADLSLDYATTDGTATAGEDYIPAAGALQFAPGATAAMVSVPILPDATVENDEFFYLTLGREGAVGASATARIQSAAHRPGVEPYVDVANVVVGEEAGAARFRVMLSQPAARDVTVGYTVTRDGAPGEPARGTLVIAAGLSEAVLEVELAAADPRRVGAVPGYRVALTEADGAALRTAEAVGVVVADPPDAAAIELGGGNPETPSLALEFVLKEDWGGGAVYDIIITNRSATPVDGWQIAMDLPFDIAEMWNAALVSDTGARVTVRNGAWNGTIAPGEAVDFGFVANAGGVALDALVSGAAIELLVE